MAMIRVSKLLGSDYNPSPNPNCTLTVIITLNCEGNPSHNLTDNLFRFMKSAWLDSNIIFQ